MWSMRLLGGFDLSLAASPARRLGPKAQGLLAYLAMSADRAVPRELLAGLLWGERDEERARHSLSQALTTLRAALGPVAAATLHADAEAVCLPKDGLDLDVASFEAAVSAGTREMLQESFRRYRGDFLAGLGVREPGFEEWMLTERYRLSELACDAFARLFELQRDGGEMDAAVETARKLLTLTPLDEDIHAHLIRLYGALGRRGLAEAHYVRCAKLLREELGQEPGEAIRAALAEARRPPGGKPGPVAPEPEFGWRAAIAVLPFANLAADERWSRLADAISEDIITDLARHGDLTVIARSSSFAYRDRDVDVREIGRALGVRYLLEGSIQAAGGRIRVTAQLIDAQTRAHLWAERYDRDEGDLFVVQDEV
ncbi:MAG: BTAD domain-containing putative transcriptional regulator, partial [Geminicoccaceae bacterium]